MIRLTIAIPTYNRSEALLATVRQLLPQLTDECKLLIVDNASATPMCDVLNPLILTSGDRNVECYRNKYNLGMCGNFMRCFELCESDWLWILGDDELPSLYAISTILHQLDLYPDCIFHNFVCPSLQKANKSVPRINSTVAIGVEDFVRKLDHFSSLSFISLNVYRTRSFLPYFSTGVDYIYSLHNFVAMILMALGADNRACFCSKVLIPNHGSIEKQWSRITHALTSFTLLELPLPVGARRCLAEKIGGTLLRLKTTATILFDELNARRRSIDEAKYIFYQICARAYYYDKSLLTCLQIVIYRLLFRYPRLSNSLRKIPIVNTMLFNEKR